MGAEDVDNEEQRAHDLKQDMAFQNKHPNPESFFDYRWNKAGPNFRSMRIMVNQLAEGIDVDKFAGIEPDLM